MPNITTLTPPSTGTAITRRNGRLVVPDDPIIPFIEGDGTGPDIWRASVRVFDAAVAESLRRQDARSPGWKCSPARRASSSSTTGCPTTPSRRSAHYLVGIKGPLTTPVGGGIRSLNVALRQMLDLFVCLRPVRWFTGVPSPVKHPEKVDMVIFRENTEDIYAGIEYAAGTPEAQKVLDFFEQEFPKEFKKIRFGTAAGVAGVAGRARGDRLAEARGGGAGRHRLQADQLSRHRAARPQRHQLRGRQQAQERDAGAQGQHHEVHGGRLPRLGLPGREGFLRRRGDRRRTVVPDSRRASRAPASSSRTPSPTSRCSRC